jgi:histidinol dehydrogenase/sulfopropanediol 3-dehydrogenase
MAKPSGEFDGRLTRIKSPVGSAASDAASVEATVKKIVAEVRDEGDAAVHLYAKAFDKSELYDLYFFV